jgi:hypothetical protein
MGRIWAGSLVAAVVLLTVVPVPVRAVDSPWLYGIHWYGDPSGGAVETMTGGKGIWSLEIVLPYSDYWWQAGGQLWQFQQMVARGHTIICRIEPNWGYAVPQPPNTPDLTQYLADVAATADVLKDVVHIWQIGNEMNLNGEWGGSVLTAANYVNNFKQIRSAIKSVASPLGEQIVLLGPVSPGGVISGVRHTAGTTYLSQMCALLTASDFDGFAMHAYAAPWNDVPTSRAELQTGYMQQLGIADYYSFHAKPVYITEWNRRVEDPNNPSDEAASALFLSGAFEDLDAWNRTPGNHPVRCACWFIYKNDPGWAQYSIEYLHSVGSGGSANDLWGAFQYACTFNYPSAVPSGDHAPLMAASSPPGVNVAPASVCVSTDSNNDPGATGEQAIDGIVASDHKWTSAGTTPPHWLQLDLGVERAVSGFIVRHAGAGGESNTFNTQLFQWQTADDAAGPWGVDTIVFNSSQLTLTARSYYVPRVTRHVRLYIVDAGIDFWARIPELEVYAIEPGDFDADGDVDLKDFAKFQACYRGPDVVQETAACLYAHFDADRDVDLDDYAGFAAALDGSVP